MKIDLNFILIIGLCFPVCLSGQLQQYVCEFPGDSFPTGARGPVDTNVGDLDGDGDNDMVVVFKDSETVVVMLNSGVADLSFFQSYKTDINPSSVALGDFDADGDLDMAVVNRGPRTLLIFLNQGDGTFAGPSSRPTLGTSNTVRSADLDGDGDVDLAVANGTGDVAVFLNGGSGIFGDAELFDVGTFPADLAIADLDNDGDLDIGTPNRFSDDISLLLNNGDGSFADSISIAAGESPGAIAMADLDNDGDIDVGIANQNSADLYVFLNDGNAEMVLDQIYPISPFASQLIAGDFDRDGFSDFLVGRRLLLNTGLGGLIDTGQINAGCCLAVENMDGDEFLDLVSADSNNNQTSILVSKNIGDVASGMQSQILDTDLLSVSDVVAGDIDGDSDADLVARLAGNQIRVFTNDGNGNYLAIQNLAFAGRFLTLADFDNDGDLDLATSDSDIQTIQLAFNDGNGIFGDVQPISVTENTFDIVSGDIDGDGNHDIVASGFIFIDKVLLLLGNGNGTFEAIDSLNAPFFSQLELFDIDLDGDLDILADADQFLLFENNGVGEFAEPVALPTLDGFFTSPILGDIDGDTDIDLVFTNFATGRIATLLNSGGGKYESGVTFETTSFTSQSNGKLVDINRDGSLDMVLLGSGPMIVFPNNGNGLFSIPSQYVLPGIAEQALISADVDGDQDNDVISFGTSAIVISRNLCILLGDINLDGAVDLLDVDPFVNLLSDGQYQFEADINQDGRLDLLDVGAFVNLLTG